MDEPERIMPDPARPSDRPALTHSRSAGARIHVPTWAYLVTAGVAMLLGAMAILRNAATVSSPSGSDLTNFILKSAAYILRGDPWHLYAARGYPPIATYPNDGTPLSLFLIAPALAAARAMGYGADFRAQIAFVSIPFVVVVPILGYLVLRSLRVLDGGIPDWQRYAAFVLVVFAPLVWLCYAPWGHLEIPLMLCFLCGAIIALQLRREVLAGVLAALALLSGAISIFPLVALGALLLMERRWGALLKVGAPAVLLTGIVMAPFFLFDRANAAYSLLLWRGKAQIGGSSVWSLLTFGALRGSRWHVAAALLRRLDLPVLLAVIVAVTLLAGWRLGVSAYSADAWAVVALGALALPILTKLNWPYYYLPPFILLLVWEFGTLRETSGPWSWPVLTVAFLVIASELSRYIGLQSTGYFDRALLGLLQSGILAVLAIAVWKRMKMRRADATNPAAAQ